MKKFLMVLLILVFFGTLVFAQDDFDDYDQAEVIVVPEDDNTSSAGTQTIPLLSWPDGFSWDGSAQIGTRIRGTEDFLCKCDNCKKKPDPDCTADVKEETKVAIIEPFGDMMGELNFYYKTGGLHLDTCITARYLAQGYNEGNVDITFGVTYIHPNDLFNFHINTNIIQASGTATAIWFSTGPDRLWMNYNMMGGDLNLYLSYKGRAEDDFEDGWLGDWRISDMFYDMGFNYYPLDSSLNRNSEDPKENPFGSGLRLRYLGVPGLDAGITFGAKGAFAGHRLDASAYIRRDRQRYCYSYC